MPRGNSKYQFNGDVGSVADTISGGTVNSYFIRNTNSSKLLWTSIIVICGIGIGYLINRLPDWDKIHFFGEHLAIILGIIFLGLIQILVTWKNS